VFESRLKAVRQRLRHARKRARAVRDGSNLTIVACALVLGTGVTAAAAFETPTRYGGPLADAVKRDGRKAHGKRIGRNADRIGKAVRHAAAGGDSTASASTTSSGGGGSLAAIAACESGGNPRAIGGGGAYRGKYQFSYGTWASVGGKGDPAAASEGEQDKRAAILMSQAGTSPWPVCG
jgi:transglycosylase-like protein